MLWHEYSNKMSLSITNIFLNKTMKNSLQKYTYYLSILLLGAIFGLILKSSQAWTEPSDAQSTAAPIHTGFTGQSKLGGLILNTDGATAGLIIEKGLVGIGTTNPQGILDITSITSALLPPRMTTLQRNAIGAPQLGMIIMNTDTKKMNLNDGSTWGEIGGGDTTYGTKTIYTGGSGNTGEYHCKKATISGTGQQGVWVNINEGLVCNSGKKCVSGSCIDPVKITDLVWGGACNSRCSAIGKTCVSIGRDSTASDGTYNANYWYDVHPIRTFSGGNCSTFCQDGMCRETNIETKCRCQ